MTVVHLEVQEPRWEPPEVSLPIKSQADYIAVAEALKAVKDYQRRVTAFFKEIKETAYRHWQAVVAKEKEALARPAAWEAECKRALAAWDDMQEQLRQAEQRRLAEEARKAEEARRLAEAAAAEAEALAEGNQAKLAQAHALLEEPVETPVVIVQKATPKVDGLRYRENWDAEVVDLHALIRHVAEHPELVGLLQPNQAALRAQARSLKGNLKLPGVRAYSTKVVVAR